MACFINIYIYYPERYKKSYQNQKGNIRSTRKYDNSSINLIPKIKVETVIPDELSEDVINAVVDQIQTGNFGDGKIFVYDVEDAIRIRTGEHGSDAL